MGIKQQNWICHKLEKKHRKEPNLQTGHELTVAQSPLEIRLEFIISKTYSPRLSAS